MICQKPEILQAVEGVERLLLQPAPILHARVVDDVHVLAGQLLIGRFVKLEAQVAVILPDGEAEHPLVRVDIGQGRKPVPLQKQVDALQAEVQVVEQRAVPVPYHIFHRFPAFPSARRPLKGDRPADNHGVRLRSAVPDRFCFS